MAVGVLIVVSDEALADLITDLTQHGLTTATAESLIRGGLITRLVGVPDASHVVCRGTCTYAVDIKAPVLGVSESQLTATGPVNERVTRQMARKARKLSRADISVSTTGVARPGPAGGFPTGTVHTAYAHPTGEEHHPLYLDDQHAAVRAGVINAVIALVRDALDFTDMQVGD